MFKLGIYLMKSHIVTTCCPIQCRYSKTDFEYKYSVFDETWFHVETRY